MLHPVAQARSQKARLHFCPVVLRGRHKSKSRDAGYGNCRGGDYGRNHYPVLQFALTACTPGYNLREVL
jgi:hypothetical protein